MSQFLASGGEILPHPPVGKTLSHSFQVHLSVWFFLISSISYKAVQSLLGVKLQEKKKKNFKTCLLKVLQIILQKECISFVSLCNSKMNVKKDNVRRSLLINNA